MIFCFYGNGQTNPKLLIIIGTTKSRADSIIEEGFKLKKKRNRGIYFGIYFTTRRKIALGYAKSRAKREFDSPAVIMCSVNLSDYNQHEWQGNEVLVFRYDHIDNSIIKRITVVSDSI